MNHNAEYQMRSARAHEAIVTPVRNVFIIAGSVLVMIAFCLIISKVLVHSYSRKTPMQPMKPFGVLVAPNLKPLTELPSPSLELDDGHQDSADLYSRQRDELNSYGWVNRSNGVARIPIQRAMELILAQGLPAQSNLTTTGSSSKLEFAK